MGTIAWNTAPTELRAWFEDVRAVIDAELDRRLAIAPQVRDDAPRRRLVEAMRYAVLGPGKRLRPALALASCEAAGGARDDGLPAAAAVELLHAYTLVHDDLPDMDDDDVRRGRPTVHIAYDPATAILTGDALLTAALGALADLGVRAADAVRVLAARAGADELIAGQMRDLALAGAESIPLEDVERLHREKTGALFCAACELGGICAGADADVRRALADYGMAIGIAFQHADDRDDDEHRDHARRARERMRALTDEAAALARGLGDAGHRLEALAAWIGSRA